MSQEEQREATYIIYRRGRAIIVSQEEWEKSWLDWWHKSSNIQEL